MGGGKRVESLPLLHAPPPPPSFHSQMLPTTASGGGFFAENAEWAAGRGQGYGSPGSSLAPQPQQMRHRVAIPEEGMRDSASALFRSQEFEHPVFIQNPSKGPLRPYYQPQKGDEFDRAVADSMPELAHRSYPPSDVLPPRIRRKSETCV